MAQKDKIKELVGRGLNSYHTKSLQQMDRIEKKNKEQNHKISILSNELDNDYLTKTEEGSVISLEHSKEGMVYLDELQGNTLVNYCTDGSKEMTLNGDIDVEGTFVTTTEGVDNGKVDVMCEGNTLVNLVQTSGSKLYGTSGSGSGFTQNIVDNFCSYTIKDNTHRYITLRTGSHKLVKPSTRYTIVFEIKENSIPNYHGYVVRMTDDSFYGTYSDVLVKSDDMLNVGIHKICFTTFSDISSSTGLGIGFKSIIANDNNVGTTFTIGNVLLLEGDWTDKEIPPYFEGMKSVGQDDTNGHKIEILSQNKNLLPVLNLAIDNEGYASRQSASWKNIKLKPNTKYTLSYTGKVTDNTNTHMWGIWVTEQVSKKPVTTNNIISCSQTEISGSFTTSSEGLYEVTLVPNNGDNVGSYLFKPNTVILEEGEKTSYIPYALNKKEILMNEPLRSLPNGVKDRFVEIGGKWFIERNCGKIVLNGSETDWVSIHAFSKTNVFRKPLLDAKNMVTDYETVVDNFIVDKLPIVKYSTYDTLDAQTVSFSSLYNTGVYNGTAIYINRNSSSDLESFKQWLSENPIEVIYQLATPIYEPLEVEPTLNTYTDITHISNNSIIPCNMKIQNTGYNAIIKPSTQYTIALDTNKSGTIGMNLGGAKGTTTNNVLKLTTPATLTDDSLRLYGKDIKGSKVRLLEGDKTNWIPSHFEGMKSSFEDKLQDDGSYKMEILSNNKNLINNIDTVLKPNNSIDVSWEKIENGYKFKANKQTNQTYFATSHFVTKPNTKYTFVLDIEHIGYTIPHGTYMEIFDERGERTYIEIQVRVTNNKWIVKFKTNSMGRKTRFTYYIGGKLGNNVLDENETIIYKNPRLFEGYIEEYEHIPNKHNKIQFSSIEPLRSTKDISDRFIFKDGKIMIERNCIERDLTYFKFSTTEIKGLNFKGGITVSDAYRQPQGGANTTMKCDKLASEFKEDTIPCINIYHHVNQNELRVSIPQRLLKTIDKNGINDYFANNPHKVIYRLAEPYYEEIPFELQKTILEGYENGTLFFDTNIPPTSTVTYAGETPIVKATKLNKTEVLNNTNDINDNIVPYLMDMDYRVVCLQLQSENINDGVSMARLFGGAYEMLQRDIQSKRYSIDEYKHRLDAYLDANKITEEEYNKLGDMLNE